MKVAALVHFAMPWRNAGSETVLHLFLRSLVEAGHEVECFVTDVGNQPPLNFEGVSLQTVRNVTVGIMKVRNFKPDVLISHHQNSSMATRYAKQWKGVKSVYLTHNDMDVNKVPLKFQPDLVIHNSQWVKESLQRFEIQGEQMVIHPPLDCERHRVESTGDAVTLINMNEHKGGKIFGKLAAAMPDQRFIGVLGGHGVQLSMPKLPNLDVVAHTPDLTEVWSETRLLLMPSIYESYGLVGIEAGCSGIPTLANDTPGLRESLGPAANFVDNRDDLNEWETKIQKVLGDYERYSDAARARSADLCVQTENDLARMVKTLESL